jgi:hypothetical protein
MDGPLRISGQQERESLLLLCALLSLKQAGDALKRKGWDLSIGDGTPGFARRRDGDSEVTTYDRFGMDGVEPLLYCRDFHGIKATPV